MKLVNTALCSYGMSGLVFHGPLLESHPGFKVTKILERTRSNSRGKHPGSEIVRDLNSILDDPSVELVIVNTPDHLHHSMAMEAIGAGKHVVVEKPLTLRTDHADQLIEAAGKKGVILTVFQNRRWDGDFLTVKEILESGKLGRLVEYESHFDRYRNYLKDSWKEQHTGTGTLYNLGSHLIDQALHLFGMPDRLFCDTRILREGARTDDSFDLFLHYEGFKCLLRSSYLVREQGPSFILHGTEGSFLKWGTDPQEQALKEGLKPGPEEWGKEPESGWGLIHTRVGNGMLKGPYPTLPGNYPEFYENLYRVIRTGAPLAVEPGEAREVVRLIEAGYESSREGKVITFR